MRRTWRNVSALSVEHWSDVWHSACKCCPFKINILYMNIYTHGYGLDFYN